MFTLWSTILGENGYVQRNSWRKKAIIRSLYPKNPRKKSGIEARLGVCEKRERNSANEEIRKIRGWTGSFAIFLHILLLLHHSLCSLFVDLFRFWNDTLYGSVLMYIVKHCELRMDIPFYKVTVLKVNVQFSDFSSKLDNGTFIKR